MAKTCRPYKRGFEFQEGFERLSDSSQYRKKGAQPPVWLRLRCAAEQAVRDEAALASWIDAAILRHDTMDEALVFHMAGKLAGQDMSALQISEICEDVYAQHPNLAQIAQDDLQAVAERDPACRSLLQPFLFFKGFLALQIYRVSHALWQDNREALAYFLQSRASELYQVDIHPAAGIGRGVMLDHATGIVIGETAIIGDGCSLLHGVTLGGTGKDRGDRHPKIGRYVLIGAGASVLGNVQVGDDVLIGSSSVLLTDVPAGCSVAGVPAQIIGKNKATRPASRMDHKESFTGPHKL